MSSPAKAPRTWKERLAELPQNANGKKSGLRRLVAAGMTLLAAAAFGYMIFSNWDSLRAFDWKLRPLMLLGAFGMHLTYMCLGALAWDLILRALGSPVSFASNLRIYLISLLGNRLPLPLAHVAGRLALYDERTSKRVLAFASTLELALLLVTGLVVGVIFSPWMELSLPVKLLAGGLGLVAIHPRPLNWALGRLHIPAPQPLSYLQTLSWAGVHCLVWLAGGGILYFLAGSIYPLDSAHYPQLIGTWAVSNVVAILMVFVPVGLGLRELTLGVLLANLIPTGIAAVIALFSRVALTLLELLVAGLASLLPE